MSEMTTTNFAFKRLRRSVANVRRNRDSAAYKAGVEVLAASILAMHKLTGQGVLQNLVVHNVDEFADVAAGGRRLDAVALLVERGDFPDDYPVPCQIINEDAVTAASLTENVQRMAMHPADEFEAFLSLTQEGWTIDRIADGFGVTPLVVERRLKLRAAAPALLAEFRAGLLSTDQLIALCSTDNHERQMGVWTRLKDQHYGKEPGNLRRAVLETEVDAAKDERVAFIGGIGAYEKAGGVARRDLFATDGDGVILEDVALLETLVDAKLGEQAELIRSEGWAWVDVWTKYDWTEFDRYGRAPTITVELPEVLKLQLDELVAQQESLRGMIKALENVEGDLTEEQEAELESLNEKFDELELQTERLTDSTIGYSPAVIELTGVLVIYQRGEMRVERGMVRAADRSKVNALLEDGQRISGGRESQSAGRKVDAISDALRRSLLGHRNLAAQVSTASNANAAKILFICKFVGDIREMSSKVPSDIGLSNGYGTRSYCPITDEAGKEKEAQFSEFGKALIEKLPLDPCELWDAVSALKASERDNFIAYAMARSVSLASETDGLTAKYLEALGLNMADHFEPTASNYLGRVSKELILEALTEAQKIEGDEERNALLGMKKAALAKEAETRLSGSGWVPALIRSPVTKSQAHKRTKTVTKPEISEA